MDRRAKKLEKKRTRRERKKKVTAIASQNLRSPAFLARRAAGEPFGPCYVSSGWDDVVHPALVTVLVTRKLPHGQFVAGVALVDRTCLGVKNGLLRLEKSARDLADFVDEIAEGHDGMIPCEPLVAQSIVYHAIDYAQSLGFEPHPDFPALLFGPRPEELLDTPWNTPERPIYVSGPYDNVPLIGNRLSKIVGAGGFEFVDTNEDGDDDVVDDEDDVIYSPLGRIISSGDTSVEIHIYRRSTDEQWALEIEDDLGGSTVWEREFESEQAALDAALSAIETQGVASFVVATSNS